MNYILIVILSLSFVFPVFSVNENGDWLRESFRESHESFADPFSLDVEADDLMKSSPSIGLGGISVQDSVLVRFARFLLRIIVLLGVTMFIFGGIRVALSFGEPEKMKQALKLMGNILLGIVLALSSVMIIFLVTALMRSSLNFFG